VLQQEQNLDEMDLKSLKALVYDLMVVGEQNQKNLQIVNAKIAEKLRVELVGNTPVEVKKEETK